MADVDLGTLKPGESTTGTVHVDNTTGSPVNISVDGGFLLVDGTDDVTSLSVPAGGADVTVKYVVQIAESAGTKQGTVAGGDASKTAQVEVEHSLTASASLLFSTLEVGNEEVKTLTVTNLTDRQATLSVSPAGSYTLASTTVAAANAPTSVLVTFAPTGVGSFPATITITAGGSEVSCDLQGSAYVAAIETAAAADGNGEVTTGADETQTTYKVHVPSFDTKMQLGAGVGPIEIDGFGLRTSGEGLLRATGDIGINTEEGSLLLRAGGEKGTIVTASASNTVFASGGSAYLMGDGGVLITTAIDLDEMEFDAGKPMDTDGMTVASNTAAAVFTGLDAFVAAASTVRIAKTTGWRGFGAEDRRGKAGIVAAGVGGLGALSAAAMGTLAATGAASSMGLNLPGVTVYGHAGVLIGTPGFGGFYSVAGLVLASVFPIVLGMDAELLGMRSAAMTGLDVSVTAWHDLTLKAGKKLEAKAAKKLEASVETETSLDTIRLEKEKLTILVGDYAVSISKDGVSVGSKSNGDLDPKKPFLNVDESDVWLATTGGDDGGWMHLNGEKAVLTGGKNLADAGQLLLEDKLSKLWSKASWIKVDGKANSIGLNAKSIKCKSKVDVKVDGKTIKIG